MKEYTQEILKEIDNEIDFLRMCSNEYELGGKSPISDIEWDRRYEELKRKVPSHSFFTEVGGLPEYIGTNSKKVKHLKIMGSLYKSRSPEEFETWFHKQYSSLRNSFAKKEFGFLLQPKIDGMAITLIYAFGKLQMAVTRGNGEIGIDVTINAKQVEGILHLVPHKMVMFEVRGEIYKNQEDFYENWAVDYSNPRNFASGTMDLDDPKEVKRRSLNFVAYEIMGLPFVSEILKINFLNQLGFETLLEKTEATQGWHGMKACIDKYMNKLSKNRSLLPYQIDGIVVKINDIVTKEDMGYGDNGKRSKANRAVKFESSDAETTLIDIEWNTSRNGRVIPTGIYDEVEINGSLNTRVTLNNYLFVQQNAIYPGSKIIVEKAGDIIPHFVKVIKGSEDIYFFPDYCSSCKSKLVEIGVDLVCENEQCSARLIKNITRWFDEIGVLGIGEATIKKMVDYGVSSISDCYDIMDSKCTESGMRNLLGDGTYTNVKNAMFNDINIIIPAGKFIKALGIPKVGSMINKVIDYFKIQSIMELDNLTYYEVINIPGFGSEKANSLVMSWIKMKPEINKILKYIIIEFPELNKPFSGINFVITGKFENPTRKEIETAILSVGGILKNSVGKDTHYLVWDGVISSSKTKRAEKLQTLVITKDMIMGILGQNNTLKEVIPNDTSRETKQS